MTSQACPKDEPILHYPVMAPEVESFIAKVNPRVVFDGTVGLGGHAKRILEKFPSVKSYIGVDVDEEALARASEVLDAYKERVHLCQGSYEDVEAFVAEVGSGQPDIILVDLGASTLQLKDGRRGFSFSANGPLDMRMDKGRKRTAADILQESNAKQLQQIFSTYGEFRFSKTLAQAIVKAKEKPTTTAALAQFVTDVLPKKFVKQRRRHPATQVFQALRIAVNEELGVIERALPNLFNVLASGGLFLAISFHSLEDRLVKRFFKERLGICKCPKDLPTCICGEKPQLELLNRRPITASDNEVWENPPSRSAKLRVARKL